MCWVSSLLPVRISAGSCGGNSIGLSGPSVSTSPPLTITRDSQKLRDYYNGGTLVYRVPKTSLGAYEGLEIAYALDRDGATVVTPTNSRVKLDIISIDS